jgi:ribosomal protein S18 acetylase RimI-like enzyme
VKEPVSIRRARATDLPAVHEGELSYIREIEPEQEARWTNALPLHLKQWTGALERMLIAESAERAVGYCFWDMQGDDAVLASLYVAPDRRREDIGRELLARFIADARARNMRNATLGVRPENPARLLYERMGFIRTHEAEGYWHYRHAG